MSLLRGRRRCHGGASTAECDSLQLASPPLTSVLRAPARVLVLAAYVLLVAAFFHPVVFGGRSLLTSPLMAGALQWGPYGVNALAVRQAMSAGSHVIDPGGSAWAWEPWVATINRMYRRAELPLWNPFMGLGMPLAANMQSGVFFPLSALLFLWPSAAVWNGYLLLRLVLIGFFTYEFLRLLRISPLNAFAGGVALMFTGHFVLYVNTWHVNVELLLPACMVAAERLVRARTWGSAIVLGFLLAASLLGGAPESALLVWAFVGLYFAFRAITVARRSHRPWQTMVAYAGPFALAVLLGVVIASPLLVLFVEYMWHGNAPTHHAGMHTGRWAMPLSGAISLIVPYFFDQLNWDPQWPPGIGVMNLAPYLGIVPLTLAALAPRRRATVFFGAYGAVLLLKMYGAPLVNVLGVLPGFNRVIFFRYGQPIVAFCVAVLMAISLEAL